MSGYLSVLRAPGVRHLLFSQLVARLPNGMLSIGFLLRIHGETGSYAEAAAVLAAMTVGQAVAGPAAGRLLVRFGVRLSMTITVIGSGACIVLVGALTLPVAAAAGVALAGGLLTPPVQQAVRAVYPETVPAPDLPHLYTLDASLQELIWVVGPVIVTLAAAAWSPAVGLYLAAGLLVVGTVWFLLAPQFRSHEPGTATGVIGRTLLHREVLGGTLLGVLLVGACSATETAVVSDYGGADPRAGIVLAAGAVGSCLGGLALSQWARGTWGLARALGLLAVGSAAGALAVTQTGLLAVVVFTASLGVAPAIGEMSSRISTSVLPGHTAEAYGWLGSGQLAGAAAGSALAGVFIDAGGPASGFAVAAGLAAGGALFTTVAWRGAATRLL